MGDAAGLFDRHVEALTILHLDPAREAQRRAFVRAACEEPADDPVRLIFADWLQENG